MEVGLGNLNLDMIFLIKIISYRKIIFQDVAKAGLKFGDEGITQ